MAPFAHRPRVAAVGPRLEHQADRRVLAAERRQRLQLLGQLEAHLGAVDDRVDALDRRRLLGAQHAVGVGGQRGGEGVDPTAPELEPGGRAVPAVAHQVLVAGMQAAEQVEGGDRASRAAGALALQRQHHDGPAAELDQPRGDDADHPGCQLSPAST